MIRAGAAALSTVAILLAGCSVTVVTPGGQAPAGGQAPVVIGGGLPDPRGWGKAWIDTTCGDFKNLMDDLQRAAYARYLLDTQRQRTVPGSAEAESQLVYAFAQGMIAACDKYYQPTNQVLAAGVFVYSQEPAKYQPPYP